MIEIPLAHKGFAGALCETIETTQTNETGSAVNGNPASDRLIGGDLA